MLCCRPLPSSPFPATTDLLPIPGILPFLEFHINEVMQRGTFCVWLLSLTRLLRFVIWVGFCVDQECVPFLFLSGVVSQSAALGEVGPSTWPNQVQAPSRRKGSPRARPPAGAPHCPCLCRHEQPGGAGAGGTRLPDALSPGLPHLSARAHDPLLEKGPRRAAHFRILAGLPGRLLHCDRAPVSAW